MHLLNFQRKCYTVLTANREVSMTEHCAIKKGRTVMVLWELTL